MKLDQVNLLAQLIDTMSESADHLEKAYSDQDKEHFEKSKTALLDFQGKIDYVLKNG